MVTRDTRLRCDRVNAVTTVTFRPHHSRPCEPIFACGFAMRAYNRRVYLVSGLG